MMPSDSLDIEHRAARAEIARDPYLEVFGHFWDGMSFLIASTRGVLDRVTVDGATPRFTMTSATDALERYMEALPTGEAQWPSEYLLWQSFAHTIIESHGLLDEYLRACFELLTLADLVAQELGSDQTWDPETAEMVSDLEHRVRRESDRFEQMTLWSRVLRMRKRHGVRIRFGRQLEAALKHHRGIRNGLVHGRLTPHAVMPDGTVARMRAYPPPPYIPLGPHVVRGTISVALAAHRAIDSVLMEHLEIEEDLVAAQLIDLEIARGRDQWLVDPWEADPEHLFAPEVLHAWRPSS